jgi:hypothetical protein
MASAPMSASGQSGQYRQFWGISPCSRSSFHRFASDTWPSDHTFANAVRRSYYSPRGSRVARNVNTRRQRCRRPTMDGAAMGAQPSDGRLTGSPSGGRSHRPSGSPAVSEGDQDQGSLSMAVSIGLGKLSISASTSPQLFPSSHGEPESSEMGRSRTREGQAKQRSPRCERGSGPHLTDFFCAGLRAS